MSAPVIKQDIKVNVKGLKKMTKMVDELKRAAKHANRLKKAYKTVNTNMTTIDWSGATAGLKEIAKVSLKADQSAVEFVQQLKKATEDAVAAYAKLKKSIQSSGKKELQQKNYQEELNNLRKENNRLKSRGVNIEARTAKTMAMSRKTEAETNKLKTKALVIDAQERKIQTQIRVEKERQRTAEQRAKILAQKRLELDKKQENELRRKNRWWNKILSKIRLSNQGLGGMTASFGGFLNNLRFGVKMTAPFMALAGAVSLLRSGFRHIIKPAMKFEEGMAHVSRTTKIVGEELERLTEKMSKVAAQTGQTHDNITKIGTVAGQLGIKGVENITRFTKTVAQMERVTDLTAEKAASAIAKVAQSFRLPISMAREIGSVINELANNTTAAATEITKALGKIGPVAANLGISLADTSAMVTTLIDTGLVAPRAGTNLRNLFILLQNKSGKIARFLGETAQKFTDELNADPMVKLQEYFDHLAGASKWSRAQHVKEVYGQENFAALETLFSLQDEFKKSRDLAREAFEEGTSMQNEYVRMMATAQGQWDFVKSTFQDILIMFGTSLLPMIEDTGRALVKLLGEPVSQLMNIEHLETQKERESAIKSNIRKLYDSVTQEDMIHAEKEAERTEKKAARKFHESWRPSKDEENAQREDLEAMYNYLAQLINDRKKWQFHIGTEAAEKVARLDLEIEEVTKLYETQRKALEDQIEKTEERGVKYDEAQDEAITAGQRYRDLVDDETAQLTSILIEMKEKGKIKGQDVYKDVLDAFIRRTSIHAKTKLGWRKGTLDERLEHFLAEDNPYAKILKAALDGVAKHMESKVQKELELADDPVNILTDKNRKLYEQVIKNGDRALAALGRENKSIISWERQIVNLEAQLKHAKFVRSEVPEFGVDFDPDDPDADPLAVDLWGKIMQAERRMQAHINRLRGKIAEEHRWIDAMENWFTGDQTGSGLAQFLKDIQESAAIPLELTTGVKFKIDEKKVDDAEIRDHLEKLMRVRYTQIMETQIDPNKVNKALSQVEKLFKEAEKRGVVMNQDLLGEFAEGLFGEMPEDAENIIKIVFEHIREQVRLYKNEVDPLAKAAKAEIISDMFRPVENLLAQLQEISGEDLTIDLGFEEAVAHGMALSDVLDPWLEKQKELEKLIDGIYDTLKQSLDRLKEIIGATRTLIGDVTDVGDILGVWSEDAKGFLKSIDGAISAYGELLNLSKKRDAYEKAMAEYNKAYALALQENKPLPIQPEMENVSQIESMLGLSSMVVTGIGMIASFTKLFVSDFKLSRQARQEALKVQQEHHKALLAKLDELKEATMNVPQLSGKAAQELEEGIREYQKNDGPLSNTLSDKELAAWEADREQKLLALFIKHGLLASGSTHIPEGFIEETWQQVTGHGGFNDSIEGLIGGIQFLTTYLEIDAVKQFEKFVDGIKAMDDVPDWIKEGLAGIDISTEEGREAARQLARGWAEDYAAGNLEFGDLRPGEFQKILEFVWSTLGDSAKESDVKTIGVSRVITDVQANEVIALLQQDVYWTKALAEFMIYGRRPPIAPTSTMPRIDNNNINQTSNSGMSNLSVNYNGDIVIQTPVGESSAQFARAAGEALQDHIIKYKGRPNRI